MNGLADTVAGPPPAPRENPDLVGHEPAQRALLAAWRSRRLPHAWLLAGPRGVGKATLAYRFARFVLANRGGAGEDGSLYLAPDHPIFRRVASGGHADLLTVERGVDEKSGRSRAEIVVDDARRIADFLHLTPAEGGWRVVVVDSADEMNRHAANAVLKILEEPPRQALLLLVSNAPSRLLPTIRSRCRKLALAPLDERLVAETVAKWLPDTPAEDLRSLARLADGSPGRALALADAGGLDLYREFIALVSNWPRLDAAAVHAFGDKLTARGADALYRTASELVLWWLARLVRIGAGEAAEGVVPGEEELARRLVGGGGLDQWLALWEKSARLFAQADRVRLDRKQVLLSVFLALETVGPARRDGR